MYIEMKFNNISELAQYLNNKKIKKEDIITVYPQPYIVVLLYYKESKNNIKDTIDKIEKESDRMSESKQYFIDAFTELNEKYVGCILDNETEERLIMDLKIILKQTFGTTAIKPNVSIDDNSLIIRFINGWNNTEIIWNNVESAYDNIYNSVQKSKSILKCK